jgi:hypothetical protein
VAQVVEHLPASGALSLNPSTTKNIYNKIKIRKNCFPGI